MVGEGKDTKFANESACWDAPKVETIIIGDGLLGEHVSFLPPLPSPILLLLPPTLCWPAQLGSIWPISAPIYTRSLRY